MVSTISIAQVRAFREIKTLRPKAVNSARGRAASMFIPITVVVIITIVSTLCVESLVWRTVLIIVIIYFLISLILNISVLFKQL